MVYENKNNTGKILGGANLKGDDLSIDELIVRDMLMCGYSMEKIGKDMDWPHETVKTHCSSVYSKLGIKSQRDLLDNGPALFLDNEGKYKRMFTDRWYWIPARDKR